MADGQMIAKEVVDAMLDEIKSSMQTTIDQLMQRNVTYRGTMKQLEMHGTALEGEVARLKELAGEIDLAANPSPPQPPATAVN
ncbi:MAG: hypothetical protein ABIY37_01505 [Devosia sp.]